MPGEPLGPLPEVVAANCWPVSRCSVVRQGPRALADGMNRITSTRTGTCDTSCCATTSSSASKARCGGSPNPGKTWYMIAPGAYSGAAWPVGGVGVALGAGAG